MRYTLDLTKANSKKLTAKQRYLFRSNEILFGNLGTDKI